MRRRCCYIVFVFCLILSILIGQTDAAETIRLTEDGHSSYIICLPVDASPQVAAAGETLKQYIEKVSGAILPIVDTSVSVNNRIVIEVGASIDSAINPAALGEDGFRVKSFGHDLYLTALTAQGLQNAVYSFIETYLGCRKYSLDFEVIPHTPTIALSEIDDTQIPRLTFRMQDVRDSAYSAWHKLDGLEDWGLFVHTFKTLVPPEKYFNDHPEYFSENEGVRVADAQLCLTNPEVFRVVVDELRRCMDENPTARYWSVSQNDTYVPCTCPNCRALDSAEGSPSGSILSFVNRVAAEFPDKTISTLAYLYSRKPPAHLKPAPNVNIMLCSIDCNRSLPIADDPKNASFVRDLKDWAALTDNIFLWDYVVQFRNLVSPFPNLRTLQPNMQFFVENGITSVFEQGVASMEGEFAELRIYLLAKLLWDPYIDIDSVMNDFLNGYYGAAAPYVREYIDAEHDALARSGEELSIYGYPYPSDDGYLSVTMLDRYERIFTQAEATVKDEPIYLHHVQTAHLPVQYAIIEQAKMLGFAERGLFMIDDDGAPRVRPEMDSLLQTFYDRCKQAGITRLWEHGNSPDHYLETSRAFIDRAVQGHLARNCSTVLASPASPKYHNGEVTALTDGLNGWDDYHFHWLGFEGNEMDATVDLGSIQPITRIETNFLQDILSWVFLPQSVEFLISEDGETFERVGIVRNSISPQQSGPIVAPFNVEFPTKSARYVRVKTESYLTCPAWHKGAGGKAWIFIDEIRVL
ncbi:MAG TPA: DUF4838 domain-containing protein [candidate division Zixibacteria bacterium]|nr:DUF4838 domain-containing protein [candidate division Zixibacteria bacterium]